MLESVNEEFLPCIRVTVLLGKIAIVCHYMKAEFPIWRFMLGVKFSDFCAERCWFWKFFCKFVISAEIIMRIRYTLKGAPCDRFRSEVTRNGVNRQRRLEFAL